MNGIERRRCHNHAGREAAARCPECRRSFCRECVSEHDDRVICAACLKKLAIQPGAERRWTAVLLQGAGSAAGLLTAWLFFYYAGRIFLAIPASVHEGTFWEESAPAPVPPAGG